MEYFYHFCTRAVQSSLSITDWVQNLLHPLVWEDLLFTLQPQRQRRKPGATLSLLPRQMFTGTFSFVPLVQTVRTRTHYATFTELNHHHFLRISNVRRKMPLALSPKLFFWGVRLPSGYSLEHYILMFSSQMSLLIVILKVCLYFLWLSSSSTFTIKINIFHA